MDSPFSSFVPDAESAVKVIEFLKCYARGAAGRRVILTIHQPSSFIWKLIDNVVLLSKGKIMYQGARQPMEQFFSMNGHPTPEGWNPADHYVTMVNDEFRDHAKSVDEWAKCYMQWEETHHLGGGPNSNSSALGVVSKEDRPERKSRSPSMLEVSGKELIETKRKGSVLAVGELTYRYFLNLWFNPGILFTRVAMYSMLGTLCEVTCWDGCIQR
jgi:ABC-type multidrug transport system ATPase subunit